MADGDEAIRRFGCPVCGALPTEPCHVPRPHIDVHAERVYLVERQSAVDRLAQLGRDQ